MSTILPSEQIYKSGSGGEVWCGAAPTDPAGVKTLVDAGFVHIYDFTMGEPLDFSDHCDLKIAMVPDLASKKTPADTRLSILRSVKASADAGLRVYACDTNFGKKAQAFKKLFAEFAARPPIKTVGFDDIERALTLAPKRGRGRPPKAKK